METFITQALSNLDGTAIAVLFICAVIIAVVTELIKAFDTNAKLSPQLIQAFTLLIGILLGVLFASATGQDWTIYVLVGLASAPMSTGIYEWVSKAFKIMK